MRWRPLGASGLGIHMVLNSGFPMCSAVATAEAGSSLGKPYSKHLHRRDVGGSNAPKRRIKSKRVATQIFAVSVILTRHFAPQSFKDTLHVLGCQILVAADTKIVTFFAAGVASHEKKLMCSRYRGWCESIFARSRDRSCCVRR